MSVYEEQQARKRSEPPARSWYVTLAAIRAAGGARECSNVAVEEAQRGWAKERAEREAEYAAGQANCTDAALLATAGAPTLIDALWENRFGGVGDER